jgi:hypothetical protein
MKPDLVLDWYFDIPNQKLYCLIDDDLEYIAHEGGTAGVTKIFKGVTTFLTNWQWQQEEKFWISEHYGERLGYYQPRLTYLIHPETKKEIKSHTGVGPDGRGLDHLQRLQIIMEGFDCALICTTEVPPKIEFITPNCGKTIFKREFYTDVSDELNEIEPNKIWRMHPQPCLMHPRSIGLAISSYDEMHNAGVDETIIERCKNGYWDAPPNPELQKFYVYPT